MTTVDRVKEDLSYVASVVRQQDRDDGLPVIYFLWAVLVPIGFALPDFAPRWAGWYWLIVGPIGGLLSWWIGTRHSERTGINDIELGRRWGYHWLVAGAAFILIMLPIFTGKTAAPSAAANILLVVGLAYALAGVHLERPLLWSGLLMFGGYLALSVLDLPYVWTTTGVVVAAALILAGVTRQHRTRA